MADPNVGAPDIILSRAFDEQVTNEAEGILPLLAPMVKIDRLRSTYFVATTDIIGEEESGYDPLIPQSLNAPARELNRGRVERTTQAQKHFWHEFVNRLTEEQVRASVGSSEVQRATNSLAALFRDLLERNVSMFYADNANFGVSNAPINLGANPDAILTALADQVAAVRPSNSSSTNYGVTIVAGTAVRNALIVALKPYFNSENPFFGVEQLSQGLSTAFGANVRLFSSSSVYRANITQPKAGGKAKQVPMWADDHLSVVGVSSDPLAFPSFAHTAVHGTLTENLFADIYTAWTPNPRGTNVFAEAFFKVDSGAPERGVKFNVTLPS